MKLGKLVAHITNLLPKSSYSKKKKLLAVLLLGTLILLITGLVSYLYLRAQPLSYQEFKETFDQAETEIKGNNYAKADELLKRLRSGGYENNPRVMLLSADLENYKKNPGIAKQYADRASELVEGKPFVFTDAEWSRLEGYSHQIYLPSPNERTPDYRVPKDRIDDPNFQG